MKKKSQVLALVLCLVFLLSTVLTGCGSDSKATPEKPQATTKLLTIGTATVGGAWYPMGGGLANVISNYVPNAKANATPSGASVENLNAIKNDKMQLGFSTSDIAYQMYNGIGYDKNQSFKSLVMNDYIYLALIVKKDSPIQKFTDIKGKKLGTGVAGSSNYQIVETVLKAHGMTYDDVKPYPSGVSQQCEALKNGNIDMFAYVVSGTGGAAPAIVELTTTTDVRFIALDNAIMDKISQEKPYYVNMEIPAGWAKGVDKPIRVLGVGSVIAVKADLPDDLVYNIMKVMFEKKNELDAIHPQWKLTNKDTVAQNLPAPLHPGAEKYCKEIGAAISYLK